MNYTEITASLIIMRCDMVLDTMGIKDSLEKFPLLKALVMRAGNKDFMEWALADDKLAGEEGLTEGADGGYAKILKLLNGETVLRSLLDLCIAVFEYPEAGAYLTYHFGHSVNLRLAFLLEGIPAPEEGEVLRLKELAENVFYFDTKEGPLLYSEVNADEKLMAFICGHDIINPLFSDITERFSSAGKDETKVIVNRGLIEEGTELFKSGGKAVQLSGKGGRRFLARRIAEGIGKDFLFINVRDFLHEAGKEGLALFRSALIREALLDHAGICFYGMDNSFLDKGRSVSDAEDSRSRDIELLERKLFLPIVDKGIELILCTDYKRSLMKSVSPGEFRNLRLPDNISYDERRSLWEDIIKDSGTHFDADELSRRYRLNASSIYKVMKSYLVSRCEGSKEDDNELFTRVCMEEIMEGRDTGLGRVVFPDITLKDVKIRDSLMRVLKNVVGSVRSSEVILDHWNLKKTYPYGRCVSLLISGPPGTGKTMTANAIAGELNLALYQVNLSNIVDKYIGETEKNLEKVFDYAERSNSVLFFDEADALFGTRSEVRDSKDRYANAEISYLLQRIEAYDGIVILATNIKGNIDPAFMRRIRYVVHFENPDEDMRREIWKNLLTEDVPHEDIDVDYLAAQFDDFTGSVIKTVFLNACAYATDNNEILAMKHLVYAVKHELEKSSAVGFSVDTLGKYAYLA